MVPMVPILLVFLGLSLGMEGAGRDDGLPRPVLKAWPSPMVRPRDNVTLRCWSAVANMTFRLGKLQDPGYWQERTVVGQEAEFLLVSPGPEAAGTYFCASRASATSGWSEPSPHVQLQVTDHREEPGALPRKTDTRTIFVATFSCLCILLLFLAVFFIYRYTKPKPGDAPEEASSSSSDSSIQEPAGEPAQSGQHGLPAQ